MPVRKVKKALHAAVLSDETVTSQPGSLDHRDWKVVARRFGEMLIALLGSAAFMEWVAKVDVKPETYEGLFFALLLTAAQWCRYRWSMPPSQTPPTPLPPQGEGLPDHSHRRHDLRIAGDTDEFFMRQKA